MQTKTAEEINTNTSYLTDMDKTFSTAYCLNTKTFTMWNVQTTIQKKGKVNVKCKSNPLKMNTKHCFSIQRIA